MDDGTTVRGVRFGLGAGDGSDDQSPYDITAAGLESAMFDAQLARLNPRDQRIVRARLHLAPIATPAEDIAIIDSHAEEKAFAKLRHPSVAKVWKLSRGTPQGE